MGGVVEVFVWINGQKRIEVVLRKRASALRTTRAVHTSERTTPPLRLPPIGAWPALHMICCPVCTLAHTLYHLQSLSLLAPYRPAVAPPCKPILGQAGNEGYMGT